MRSSKGDKYINKIPKKTGENIRAYHFQPTSVRSFMLSA